MSEMLIHSASYFDGDKLIPNTWALLTDSGAEIGQGDSWQQRSAEHTVDATGKVLLSGLFDTHCHGAMGHAAQDGLEGMRATLDFNFENGVARSLLSMVSAPAKELIELCEQAQELRSDERFAGIHLEGPYLSQGKKGAHNPEIVGPPKTEDLREIAKLGTAKSITIAPELFEESQLDILADAGLQLCFGHSEATYEQAKRFFARYPSAIMTHAFNGMNGIHHRAPGPIPAAIEAGVMIELIADGIHVEPAAARLLPEEKVILITDAMAATGMPDGEYNLGSMVATVKDGVARTESGSLAGSTLRLHQAVRHYGEWIENPELALRAATSHPAAVYGVELPKLSSKNFLLL